MADIAPAQALAHLTPKILDELSPADRAIVLYDISLWLRPEQVVPPPGGWRSLTFIAGRRWGKTFGIGADLNRGVQAGDITLPGLIAPTEDDFLDVQWPAVRDTARLGFEPELYKGGIRWPNGVFARVGTAGIERPLSGVNTDYVWMTELVKWPASTGESAFDDVTTTCSVGRYPRYLVDTTSKGVSRLILRLIEAHQVDPTTHLLRRGTMFENPVLTDLYLRTETSKYTAGSRRYREEILGEAFTETAGALWQQAWIDDNRRACVPLAPDQVLLAWDPAMSDSSDADEQGLCKVAAKTIDGALHVFVAEDYSARAKPIDVAKTIVRECLRDASGVLIETNRGGQHMRALVEAEAQQHGLHVEVLAREQAFPRRSPRRIYVREHHTAVTKEHRAQPAAALYAQGRVHHTQTFARLEYEMVTWDADSKRSPNRLDAMAYAVTEAAGVATPTANGRAAVSDATAAHAELQRLLSRRRGRRGLGVG